MSDKPNQSLRELLDSDQMKEIRRQIQESNLEYEKDCNQFWDNLDYEDQLKAFYSVCKLIRKGDIEERGTYRYVLYDVFGFGMDAYMIGMECGYMDIHNFIAQGTDAAESKKVEHANRDDDSQSSDL